MFLSLICRDLDIVGPQVRTLYLPPHKWSNGVALRVAPFAGSDCDATIGRPGSHRPGPYGPGIHDADRERYRPAGMGPVGSPIQAPHR
ncbi:hypothetical protein [Lysobacter gummosus]|uniref:hypothetical protein n=1 Tax=Lysobacter gummosus TaxID=262324 RepID=UPI00363BD8AC